MYCELNSRFRHSRFTILHVLRTYLCSLVSLCYLRNSYEVDFKNKLLRNGCYLKRYCLKLYHNITYVRFFHFIFGFFADASTSRISRKTESREERNFSESLFGDERLLLTWKNILSSPANMYEIPYPSSATGPNPPPGLIHTSSISFGTMFQIDVCRWGCWLVDSLHGIFKACWRNGDSTFIAILTT